MECTIRCQHYDKNAEQNGRQCDFSCHPRSCGCGKCGHSHKGQCGNENHGWSCHCGAQSNSEGSSAEYQKKIAYLW